MRFDFCFHRLDGLPKVKIRNEFCFAIVADFVWQLGMMINCKSRAEFVNLSVVLWSDGAVEH